MSQLLKLEVMVTRMHLPTDQQLELNPPSHQNRKQTSLSHYQQVAAMAVIPPPLSLAQHLRLPFFVSATPQSLAGLQSFHVILAVSCIK